ncbi:orotate phosphoribosyltransferase [Candidatus Woesearchaeota archaeon]|nr:MAG: orotate phosphoribosyltransferase [Candidatus Woesearchaeota archaeon]
MEKQGIIKILVDSEAVRFGKFKLKSGREAPYFVDIGELLKRVTYLDAIAHSIADKLRGIKVDCFFGPAYKGIPLATLTAMHYAAMTGDRPSVAYDRKEAKMHGEGGVCIGHVHGDVMIVDDVFTTGGTKKEAIEIVRSLGGNPIGIFVCLDRCEASKEEFEKGTGVKVYSLVDVYDLIDYLKERSDEDKAKAKEIEEYLKNFYD